MDSDMSAELETLRSEFYRCILVRRLLSSVRATSDNLITNTENYERRVVASVRSPRNTWRDFLDSLSSLCDFNNGGKTVPAIAVEESRQRFIFWIRCNGSTTETGARNALEHLGDIIEHLQKLLITGTDGTPTIREKIFTTSVQLSSKKIAHYRHQITSIAKQLRSKESSPTSTDIINSVVNLLKGRTDEDLCREVHTYYSSPIIAHLRQKAERKDSKLWQRLCHYISRLGSWLKATRVVCGAARHYSEMLRVAEVKLVPCIPPEGISALSPMPDLSELFTGAASGGLDMSLPRVQAIFGLDAVGHLEKELLKFREHGWQLRLHSEAVLAQFFHSTRRQFAQDDRYIGCSKASCSCCDLYLEMHPGGFERRRCHGNTWIQWDIPGLGVTSEAKELLQRMTARLRDEVRRDFILGYNGHALTLDSSTDMTALFDHLRISRT